MISSLPIISAITALQSFFTVNHVGNVGVLGVRQVMETNIFGMSGVDIVGPSAAEQARVHHCYVALALAGSATEPQKKYLRSIAQSLREDNGAVVILLAGTDLSRAFDCATGCYHVLGSAHIPAAAIARRSMGIPAQAARIEWH